MQPAGWLEGAHGGVALEEALGGEGQTPELVVLVHIHPCTASLSVLMAVVVRWWQRCSLREGCCARGC